MGRRKFRLGRPPRNYERKRQARKTNSIGWPSKKMKIDYQQQVEVPIIGKVHDIVLPSIQFVI